MVIANIVVARGLLLQLNHEALIFKSNIFLSIYFLNHWFKLTFHYCIYYSQKSQSTHFASSSCGFHFLCYFQYVNSYIRSLFKVSVFITFEWKINDWLMVIISLSSFTFKNVWIVRIIFRFLKGWKNLSGSLMLWM